MEKLELLKKLQVILLIASFVLFILGLIFAINPDILWTPMWAWYWLIFNISGWICYGVYFLIKRKIKKIEDE